MKTVITAVVVSVEQTVYNDEYGVVSRPDPRQNTFTAFETTIPEAVRDWVMEQLAKRGA